MPLDEEVEVKQYKELQYIWHTALYYKDQKRHNLAIRLFNEGIKLAKRYKDTQRLYQLYRDCEL